MQCNCEIARNLTSCGWRAFICSDTLNASRKLEKERIGRHRVPIFISIWKKHRAEANAPSAGWWKLHGFLALGSFCKQKARLHEDIMHPQPATALWVYLGLQQRSCGTQSRDWAERLCRALFLVNIRIRLRWRLAERYLRQAAPRIHGFPLFQLQCMNLMLCSLRVLKRQKVVDWFMSRK